MTDAYSSNFTTYIYIYKQESRRDVFSDGPNPILSTGLQFSVSLYWTIYICEVHISCVNRIWGPINCFLLKNLRKSILKRQNTSTSATTSKKTLTHAGWHKLEVYFKELLVSAHNAYPPFAKEWT